jgi:predicted transcriptional regulator
LQEEKVQALTVELPPEAYRRLQREAMREGKLPKTIAEEWLVERLAATTRATNKDREQMRQALQAAGLLTELGPDLRRLSQSTVRIEDVRAALDRVGGKPLSEIVLEQRGSKL